MYRNCVAVAPCSGLLVFQQATKGNCSLCPRERSLGHRIGDVVPIDVLAVAIDPRSDDTKAVESGSCRPVVFLQIKRVGVPVEHYGDLSFPTGAQRIVVERPIMILAVGINMIELACRRGAALPAFGPLDGIEAKALAAGSFDVDSKTAFRNPIILRFSLLLGGPLLALLGNSGLLLRLDHSEREQTSDRSLQDPSHDYSLPSWYVFVLENEYFSRQNSAIFVPNVVHSRPAT